MVKESAHMYQFWYINIRHTNIFWQKKMLLNKCWFLTIREATITLRLKPFIYTFQENKLLLIIFLKPINSKSHHIYLDDNLLDNVHQIFVWFLLHSIYLKSNKCCSPFLNVQSTSLDILCGWDSNRINIVNAVMYKQLCIIYYNE